MKNKKINNIDELESNIKSIVKKQKDMVQINNVLEKINKDNFDPEEFYREQERIERIRKYRLALLISFALIIILTVAFFLIPSDEGSAINPKTTVHLYVIGNISDYSEKLNKYLDLDQSYKAIVTNGAKYDTIITEELSEIDINSFFEKNEISISSIKNIMNDLIHQKFDEDHKYILIGSSKVEKPQEANQSLFNENDFDKLKKNKHELYVVGTFEVGKIDDVIATSFEYYGINFQKIEIKNENQ